MSHSCLYHGETAHDETQERVLKNKHDRKQAQKTPTEQFARGGGGAEREIQPPCNASGRNLLETCTAFSLRNLNGRIVGDLEGKRTCFHDNGSSVVDYLLESKSILRNVRYLIVNH